MDKEEGFILQTKKNYKQQWELLTRKRGRLSVSIPNKKNICQFSPGTRIAFHPHGNAYLYAEDIEVVSIPQFQTSITISWVHHILELSYYFSQPELFDETLFMSVATFFQLLSLNNGLFFNKNIGIICVFHLLCQTGFYYSKLFIRHQKIILAMNSLFDSTQFDEIANTLHFLVKDFTLAEVAEIEAFVMYCLQQHPFYRHFKTVHFVYSRDN